jgi:hypothetical protein
MILTQSSPRPLALAFDFFLCEVKLFSWVIFLTVVKTGDSKGKHNLAIREESQVSEGTLNVYTRAR